MVQQMGTPGIFFFESSMSTIRELLVWMMFTLFLAVMIFGMFWVRWGRVWFRGLRNAFGRV